MRAAVIENIDGVDTVINVVEVDPENIPPHLKGKIILDEQADFTDVPQKSKGKLVSLARGASLQGELF